MPRNPKPAAAFIPAPGARASGGFLDLGVIKGNIDDQNYTLPANFDAQKYGSVSIWCKRFAVNFGSASLQPDAPAT